jgi:SAM-dependent methyltransferase
MNNWAQFYQDRINDRYLSHIERRYGTFIELLRASISNEHKYIVEFGSGPGNITKLLDKTHKNKEFILLDNNKEILNLAKENLQRCNNLIKYIEYDIRNEYIEDDIKNNFKITPDLIHSHGVLEHFSNEEIKMIIDNQKCFNVPIIHYVPSWKYRTPSFGDERLLTAENWKNICNPDKIIEFNDGYDYALCWNLK